MFELVMKSNFEILECNFDEIEAKLRALIDEKYNIAVTEDSVKEAKNIRAEINKGKKALEQVWREKKQELEAPIKNLNERAKGVFSICDEAMSKIDMQVNQFEAKKRELAVSLCEEYKNKLCTEKGIPTDVIDCRGLNNLTFVTEKGGLSSQGKQAVESLVMAKEIQIQEQKRIELEKQLEVERIKKEAINDYVASQPQPQPQPQIEQPQPQPQVVVNVPKEEDKSLYVITSVFCVNVKGEWSNETADKVKDFFVGEFKKNAKLDTALQNIEVTKA